MGNREIASLIVGGGEGEELNNNGVVLTIL